MGEAGVRAFLVVDLEHADRLVARDQRYPHAGAGTELPRHLLVHLGIVDHRVDALATPALEHRAALRLGTGDGRAEQVLSADPCDRGEPQLVAADRQRKRDDPRLEELAQAPDDEIEQPLEIGLGGQRIPDLLQRLQLPRPPDRGLVEARVLDRDRRLAGEQPDELLVFVREILAALLLGEVEVAVGDAAQHDRHAEEAVHRWMSGREADRTRILREIVQPQRLRLADQHAEDAPSARQRADLRAQVVVDPVGDELLELRAARVDHPERRVASTCQLGRRLHEPA